MLPFKINLPQEIYSQDYQELGRRFLPYPVDISSWQGAINCLLISDGAVPGVFLIKRSEIMPRHRGQVGMIGGLKNIKESDPIAVAGREFEEETSLSRSCLEVLGLLPPVYTSNQSLIIPTLARVNDTWASFKKQIQSNGEWSHGLFVPLEQLTNEKNWTHAFRYTKNGKGVVLFCGINLNKDQIVLYKDSQVPDHVLLWGASARVLWNLLRIKYNS